MPESPPVRGRGLKTRSLASWLALRVPSRSPPVRGRGLKPSNYACLPGLAVCVAPRAGAWIETDCHGYIIGHKYLKVAPRAGAWIETQSCPVSIVRSLQDVAPRAGAWIETSRRKVTLRAAGRSPPVRGRGLKLSPLGAGSSHQQRASSPPVRGRGLKPLTLRAPYRSPTAPKRRPPCGGVD